MMIRIANSRDHLEIPYIGYGEDNISKRFETAEEVYLEYSQFKNIKHFEGEKIFVNNGIMWGS